MSCTQTGDAIIYVQMNQMGRKDDRKKTYQRNDCRIDDDGIHTHTRVARFSYGEEQPGTGPFPIAHDKRLGHV